ncbi:MAG: TRAP transporter small permease [Syntrophales bacterium]|nr:TRAP transporter small permease [Syntrophales bacterium]
MKYLDQFDQLLNKTLMIAGGAALITLMLLATGNVVLRLFHVPLSGTYEIVSFLGAVVTASALGYTQRNKDHIVVDILSDKFPAGLKFIVDACSYLAMTIFFAVVSWQTFIWGMKIRESGELSETLKIMYHPFVFGVSLGFAVLTTACIVDLIKTVANRKEGDL